MALSDAEKQKRYRRHRVGDHSLCPPQRECRVRQAEVEAAAGLEPLPESLLGDAPELGVRGRALWVAMSGVQMGPAHRALLVETCRLVDRLDRFDRVLSGGRWFFDRVAEDNPDQVEIVVDQMVSEARQGASALKVLVAQLEPKPTAAALPVQPKAPSGLASLTARIESRRAGNL